MSLNFRLEQKMSQSLVMTPRLQQAIKLLQYNTQELCDHIQEALNENPTLEVVPDSDGGGLSDGERELRAQAERDQQELVEQRNGSEDSIDWERFIQSMGERSQPRSLGGTIHDDLPPIETNLTYGESLSDHLMFQAQMMRLSDDELRAVDVIVHNLDNRGYLVAVDTESKGSRRGCQAISLEELAAEVDVSLEVMDDALELVQGFDPIGCGARDLSECLVIQAKREYPEDPHFVALLMRHIGNLERRRYGAIARDLDIEEEDVIEYHRMLKNFEPLPGRNFVSEEPRYITPDLYLQKRNGAWEIRLNEDGMPDLRISSYYQREMQRGSREVKDYLIDKLRNAEFLIKSIHRRRRTIVEVMRNILMFQEEFFEKGKGHIRPLTLQQVAEQVYTGKEEPGDPPAGVHMSTVSRVTTNKYVHTPHGIFELKHFFRTGVRQSGGADMSNEAIKQRIHLLVQAEDPKRPLSDQKIANQLKAEGTRVARRTVAKYREAMGILPSSQRKNVF
jgi:RNA polymerase sigma-54 factor